MSNQVRCHHQSHSKEDEKVLYQRLQQKHKIRNPKKVQERLKLLLKAVIRLL